MKKIIFFLITYIFFSFSIAHGAWYGNTPISYANGTTECPSDYNYAGGVGDTIHNKDRAVTNSPSSLTPIPAINSFALNSIQTNKIDVASSGTMYCLKWDGAVPTVSNNYTYSGVWRNSSSVTITLTASDSGGSGVNTTKWCEGSICNPSTGTVGTSITKLANYNNTIRYQTWDNAGNASAIGTVVVKLDNTIPTVTDNYPFDNTWTNGASKIITLTSLDTGGSGVSTTKWCEGVTCTPSTGTVGTSITKLANYNNTIRYQTWDVAGNASAIGTIVVKLDNSLPIGTLTYTNGWTNQTSQTVNYTYSDPTISGILSIALQRRGSTNSPTFSTWTGWSTVATGGTSYPFSGNNHTAYQFRLIITDLAGNQITITPGNTIKIDTTLPNVSTDITNSNSDLLANASFNYNFNVGDASGSPIVKVQGYTEDKNNQGGYNTIFNCNASSCTTSWDIRNVDNYRTFDFNTAREYSIKITYIEDQAGNKVGLNNALPSNPGIKTYNHNVYANHSSAYIGTKKIQSNPFASKLVADGVGKDLTIQLEDIYSNEIIPSGTKRIVSFAFTTNNTLYQNQYKSTGNAVYVKAPDNIANQQFTIGSNQNKLFSNQPSTNGNYPFIFEVYAPTYQNYKAALTAGFEIQDIKATIGGTLGSTPNIEIQNGLDISTSNKIVFDFQPLYYTTFSGDQKTNGMIIGPQQLGAISLQKSLSSVSNPNINVYLEFGSGARVPIPNLVLTAGTSSGTLNEILEGNQVILPSLYTNTSSIPVFTPLYTKLSQSGTISGLHNTYLSSHIAYTLAGKDIVLNSDILGKSNYFDNTSEDNTVQNGIKIIGVSSSKISEEILEGQFTDDVKIFGNIYKASLKRDVVENAYSFVKGILVDNGSNKTITDLTDFTSSSSNGGMKIDNGNVLYFGPESTGLYRVDLGNGDEMVSGKKTIVIIGGNLYIKNSMHYQNKLNDILGIIVLKDKNGNGGNIYVNPGVTNIVGTLFAERSIINYDGNNELDGDTLQSVLKNQLHIYGSVFSENTIGGSVLGAPACPYYIAEICTLKIAQKYDLNLLRRYYLSPYNGLPVNTGKVIGNGTCTSTGATGCDGDSDYQSYITNLSTHPYARYPVVIEYNPMLSTNPPPLFSK